MEHIIKLRCTLKCNHNSYCFYLNKSDEVSTFVHDLFGQSSIPLIGKYNNDEYNLLEIPSLVTQMIDLNDKTSINLPDELVSLLREVKTYMIYNNTKSSLGNFNPTEKIKFYWVIANNKLFNQAKTHDVYNIVPHLFLNPSINFEKTKRIEKVFSICIYIPTEMKESSGIDQFIDLKKNQKFSSGISFNIIRQEFSSIHFKGGGIAFSPNNLKFILHQCPIAHFFILLLDDQNYAHHVFYYWVINDPELGDGVNKSLLTSFTINDLIANLRNVYGDSLLPFLNFVDKMIVM